MRDLFFSVIVPVYNTEQYLEKCIGSVLNQTFSNYELILINNGSQDRSGEIINSFLKDSRIIKYDITNNQGISFARNQGLKMANGKYVIFLDSDDFYIDEEFFEKAYRFLSKNNVDLLLFSCIEFLDKQNKYGNVRQNVKTSKINQKSKLQSLEYLVKSGHYSGTCWNKIFKHSVINNLFFLNGIRGEDVEWFYRVMIGVKNIGALKDTVYAYRVRGNSTSKSGWNLQCWEDIYDFLYKECNKLKNVDSEQLLLLDSFTYFYYILIGMAQKYDNTIDLLNKLKSINYYKKIRISKKNKYCYIIIKLFGIKNASKIFYKYILR